MTHGGGSLSHSKHRSMKGHGSPGKGRVTMMLLWNRLRRRPRPAPMFAEIKELWKQK